jgi:hypothetical protein
MPIKKTEKSTKLKNSNPTTIGNHICFVVKDRDATVKTISAIFGLTAWIIDNDTDSPNKRPYKLAWGNLGKIGLGQLWIEVLQPLGKGGPISEFLKNRGEGLYHLSLVVPNWEELVASLKDKGINMTIKSNDPEGFKECAIEVTPGGPIIEIKNEYMPKQLRKAISETMSKND